MKTVKYAMIASISALALAACSSEAPTDAPDTTEVVADESTAGDTMVAAEAVGDKNIVALAQTNPQASTLVSAVTAAGLAETLSGPGPFTVFAPTNDAFAKVDKATLEGLMKPESGRSCQDDYRWQGHRYGQDAKWRQSESQHGRRQDRADRCQGRQGDCYGCRYGRIERHDPRD
jgi:uncharacterized surface protein with fasciclin (FAS1) repeats